MRVTYQSGEVYLSMTKEEADHIHENKGKPVPIGVRTLKILHEDVSNCVAFLASDMSSYVNGEVIDITGGY